MVIAKKETMDQMQKFPPKNKRVNLKKETSAKNSPQQENFALDPKQYTYF